MRVEVMVTGDGCFWLRAFLPCFGAPRAHLSPMEALRRARSTRKELGKIGMRCLRRERGGFLRRPPPTICLEAAATAPKLALSLKFPGCRRRRCRKLNLLLPLPTPPLSPYLSPPSAPPPKTPRPLLVADCAALVTSLARGPCAVLKPVLHGQYGQPSAYATADCSQLTGEVERLGLTLSDTCCIDARAFVDTGCACSPDVQDLLVGLRVLPAGADPVATINGLVGLMQGSRCSIATFGGPVVNPCSGSAGCPSAA